MKSIGKKLLSLVMVLALMLGFAPGMGMTARAETEIPTDRSNAGSGDVYFVGYTTGTQGGDYSLAQDGSYMFDTNGDTKACIGFSGSYSVEFSYASEITPHNYYFRTGDDTSSFTRRNPSAWTLEGKVSENNWTVLDSRSGQRYTTDDNTEVKFDISNNTAYQTFRLTITAINSDGDDNWPVNGRPTFQLSEFYMSGTIAPASSVASVTSGSTTTNYSTFTDAVSAWKSAAANATLTLLSDVAMSSTINVTGAKTLDLNGYGIKMSGNSRVFLLNNGGSLIINDSAPTRSTHKFTVSANGLAALDENGNQSFQGGYITGANSTADSNAKGWGGVAMVGNASSTKKESLIINGGTLIGNYASNSGGAVRVNGNCTFTMTGGAIIYNTSGSGGAVSGETNVSFQISGGTIANNRAAGAVHNLYLANNQKITLSGTLSDASIGVTMASPGVFTTGGIAKDCAFSSDNSAYTVQLAGSELKLALPPVASVTSGGTTTEYTTFTDALSHWTDGGTLTLLSDVTTSSTIMINDSNAHNLILDLNGYGIRYAGAPTVENDEGHIFRLCNPDLTFTLKDADPNRTHYITLTNWRGTSVSDTGTASSVSNGNGVVKITGGYLTGGARKDGNSGDGGAINMGSGGTFVMEAGTIIGNVAGNQGGAVNFWGGTFTMSGGAIAYNYSGNKGGGVCYAVSGSSFNLNGGTIKDNYAQYGGGVYVASGAILNMTEGTIEGNRVTANGAGAAVEADATFCMTGGAIRYNAATGDTGGVLLRAPSVNFTMSGGSIRYNTARAIGGLGIAGAQPKFSGTPVIRDNVKGGTIEKTDTGYILNGGTPCNVYNTNNSVKMEIAGELLDGAEICVTMQTPDVFADSTNTAYNDPTKFVSDNASYIVGKNENGQLLLGAPVTVTFNTDSGSAVAAQTVAIGSVLTKPDDPTREGYTFDDWYKEEACTNAWDYAGDAVSSNTTLYAKWIINQYTVTFDTDGGSTVDAITQDFGTLVTVPDDPTKTDYSFAGWNTAADGTGIPYSAGATFHLTDDLTLYAQWTAKAVYAVTGTVKQSDNAPAGGVTVRLVQGEKKIAVTATKADGTFSFSAPDGIYNIIAEQDGKVKTKLVTLDAEQNIELVMPAGNVKSELAVTGTTTPNVMVGGLDELAEESGEAGKTVTVTMTVEEKSDAENADELQSFAETQEHPNQSVDCLEISVQKTVDAVTENMPTTNRVLEIIVPYHFTGKEYLTVYRYHDSAAELERLDVKPESDYQDGTCYFDLANGLIYIYANQFSTYAVGYTQCYNINGMVSYGTYSGTVSVSLLDSETEEEKYATKAAVSSGSGAYSFAHILKGTYTLRTVWIEGGKENVLNETVNVW